MVWDNVEKCILFILILENVANLSVLVFIKSGR